MFSLALPPPPPPLPFSLTELSLVGQFAVRTGSMSAVQSNLEQ
jgi:hypothetical protein